MVYMNTPKRPLVERVTLKMKAVALEALVESTRLPTHQKPTIEMRAVVVTEGVARLASAT